VKKNLIDKKSFSIIYIRSLISFAGSCYFVLALSAAPISSVSAFNGTQPLFVLVFSIFMSVFFPKIIKENIEKVNLITKIIAASLIVVGAVIISL